MLGEHRADHGVAGIRGLETESDQRTPAPNVGEGVCILRDRTKPLKRVLAHLRNVVRKIFPLDDLDEPAAAHHVHEVAAPGRVDAAGLDEHVVGDLIDAGIGIDAADLRLLAETDDIGLDVVMLPEPGLARTVKTRLDFIEDQHGVFFVGELAKPGEKLGAEVIVATLALHGLDDDRGNLVAMFCERRLDLIVSALFLGLDVVGDVAFKVEDNRGIMHPRPVELGEQADLVGHGVGEAHGVARATMKRLLKMQDHQVVDIIGKIDASELAGFPVEGGLEGVLHRQAAPGDPEVMRIVRGGNQIAERINELRHFDGIQIGVGDIAARGIHEFHPEIFFLHPGMVVADRPGCEAGEGVEIFISRAGIVQPGAV